MLANVIADNFDSRDNIDWEMLTKYPEFSGYSNKNLIMLLSSFIGFATHRFKIDKF